MSIHRFELNGEQVQVDTSPEMPLLWVLRDVLNLTGTKFGCGIMQCGACTVHVDGRPTRTCQLPIAQVADIRFVTGPPMIRSEDGKLVGFVFVDTARPIADYVQDARRMIPD